MATKAPYCSNLKSSSADGGRPSRGLGGSGMRFFFLGTGAAFTVAEANFQSNAILEDDAGRRLLIDCGTDARRALAAAGLTGADVDAVYISHLHGDHIGGLEWLGLSRYFSPESARPRLILAETLVTPLWHDSLKGGMASLPHGPARLEDFFTVEPVPERGSFLFGTARLTLVPVAHIRSGGTVMRSHGLMIEAPGQTIFFTSDCLHQPERLAPAYRDADLIFQDCDTGPAPTGAHAHFEELRTLPEAIRARMWLYHYADGPLPDARGAGFAGFVRPRRVFALERGEPETDHADT